MSEAVDLKDCLCLNCSRQLVAATAVGEAKPVTVGAVSICFYCGAISIFTKHGLRHPKPEERESLTEAVKVRDALMAIKRRMVG